MVPKRKKDTKKKRQTCSFCQYLSFFPRHKRLPLMAQAVVSNSEDKLISCDPNCSQSAFSF